MLYLGQNEWAHVNCCLWSAEVFEEDNGSLLHVHSAVARGRLMVINFCYSNYVFSSSLRTAKELSSSPKHIYILTNDCSSFIFLILYISLFSLSGVSAATKPVPQWDAA